MLVKKYQKGAIVQLSENFWLHEFDCHCRHEACQFTIVCDELVAALELLRPSVGHRIHIDDAYRCPSHNKEVGGVEHSQHVLGLAADIKTSVGVLSTIEAAESVPAFKDGGVGEYQHFVHTDVRGHRVRWKGPGC